MPGGHSQILPFYGTEGTHSYEHVVKRLQAATDRIRKRVNVDPHSRVARWSEALSRLMAAGNESVLAQMLPCLQQGKLDHPFRASFRALVESRLFVEIIEQLEPQLNTIDLRDLISGNYDPALDLPSNRARDREFELFAGAICRRAGLDVTLSEPDVVIESHGRRRVIAAKRLSSRRNIGHNVARASAQIANSGIPGFILLDVTRILDPEYLVVTHWRSAHQTVAGPILHFKNTEYRTELTRKRNEHVLGIVLRAAFPHISIGCRLGTDESWWAVAIQEVNPQEVDRFLGYILKSGRGC